MKMIETNCPKCGAKLKMDINNKEAYCEHCDSSFLIDDEVKHVQYDDAEETGYQFEKGRQRALRERNDYDVKIILKEEPKKKNIWLWAIGWLVIFPLPLTIILLRKKGLKPVIKYGVIGLAWISYLMLGAFGGNATNQNTVQTNSITTSDSTVVENDKSFIAIDTFIEKFNTLSSVKIDGYESFNVQDEDSGYYRVEFRLLEYKNVAGAVCDINGKKMLLVDSEKYSNNKVRMYYLPGYNDEDAEEISWATLNIIDSSISRDTISGYFSELKNGYDGRNLMPLNLTKNVNGLFLKDQITIDVEWDN